mmetsp:Transcript_25941/g.54800  ORF Transcript_25941/g.54800 Transcript_25941/m.54800 type:complete len:499 (+) Transcript_25941:118-1614(+)
MSPKERDPSLPAIPEDSQAKLRSAANWNDKVDEDAEDQEEQGLFEKDNTEEGSGNIGDGDENNGSANAYPLRNDGEDLQRNSGEDATDDDGRRLDPGPFYVQSSTSGESWELTWPIWHLLPANERRAIATQHGMKSIGEFEEYMTLSRAVDESEGIRIEGQRSPGVASIASDNTSPGNGEQTTGNNMPSGQTDVSEDATWHPPFIGDQNEEDDDSSVSSAEEDNTTEAKITSDATEHTDNIDLEDHLEMIRLGGLPCSIPDEILHKCFAYLPIDDFANLALVSPHWSRFTRCESLYKSLCQRIYLKQSKRKTLHISRFGNSYRKMLEVRPRVRTNGGVYVLKYQEIRKIQRDMWTEIPVGAILESVYYRYLYFFEDGRVMYALTHATPVEMIPRFSKMLIHGYGSKDKWGVWGRYQIKKDEVRAWASQDWHDVCFQLKVIPSNKVIQYSTGDKGMYTTMVLEKHMSSPSGNFEEDSYDLVKYEIPTQCYFRFLRDRRL